MLPVYPGMAPLRLSGAAGEGVPGRRNPPVTAELRARFPLVMKQMPRLGQDEKFRRTVRLL
ncbi:hypothetical protein AB0M94_37360 [Streptomyces xanthochromogenes]|uniref:hypothetical protein n=1 Tax=Streptomyces xanthochromogenes TaxID=67384 RepID=UPI0034323753